MKKLIAIILCLGLCLGAMPALAAPGDAALFRRDESGYSVGVNGAAAVGDTLYVATYEGLYAYKVGDESPTALTMQGEAGNYYDMRALFAHEGKLYVLNSTYEETGDGQGVQKYTLNEVAIAGDQFALQPVAGLDTQDLMIEDGEYSYMPSIYCPIMDGDKLLALVEGDYRQNRNAIYAFDLNTGKHSAIDTGALSPVSLIAYTPGKALLLLQDTKNWGPLQLHELDLAAGQTKELGTVPGDAYGVYGPYWDQESATFYYGSENVLYTLRLDDMAAPTRVCDLPLGGHGSPTPGGMMLPGGYFACYGYDAVLVRNTDPNAQPEKYLKVSGYYEPDEAYYAFTARNPQVGVTLSSYMSSDDITQAMMNRSPEPDLLRLEVSSDAFRALAGRGYLMPITDQAIVDQVAAMYPQIREAVTVKGQLVALPVDAYASSMHYNVAVLKKLGLTESELPTTWAGMIDFIAQWGDRFQDDFPELTLFEPPSMPHIRNSLAQWILESYMASLDAPGAQVKYDTPLLRDLLAKLDQADFSQVETEESEDGSYSWDGESVLFETSSAFNSWSETKSWPIKLSEDGEYAMPLQLTLMVVNPFSPNQQEAIAYLNCVAEKMNRETRIMFMPGENEPMREPGYETQLVHYKENIEQAKKELDEARPEDKQGMEEFYKNMLQNLEDYENNYSWRIKASQIQDYRKLAENLVVVTNQGIGEKNRGELMTMVQRYIDRELSVDQFLKTLDQKVRMMMMEGY